MSTRISAVLFDFGGVLTTSLIEAFEAFGATLGVDPRLPLRLLAKDERSGALLVEHEEGRLGQREFEDGFAERLRAHGADIQGPGLLSLMQAGLRPDRAMLDLVAEVRNAGHRVGLLSNSLGDDCYAGFDLESMFDAVVISGEIGVRKPSRRAYAIACERLGTEPGETVMVDDLEHNIVAARRAGLAGILHREAATTAAELRALLHQGVTTAKAQAVQATQVDG
ncbi:MULTISPECIES: HAD family phosphatase [unclassified Streptomyces]|uniref:HAD family hydrolase n=1 Tax=unclassified Streptomyces TaxID=2593676 RepID=UPI002E365AA3|nr:HAD family phosphatase [Streptomyces sp. NBC_01280]WSE20332.1 HAD family phosphatase [Streptomyces sp. NBC_01397]